MNTYVVRVDFVVEAESEDDAVDRYGKNEGNYDGVYEVILEEEDLDDEEDEA